MKKRGFTLSELLIALGIVAVTAAMVVPMFSSLIPDKNKMKVISYYNKINEINQKLLSDKNLFPTEYGVCDDSITNDDCSSGKERYIKFQGLANKEKPVDDSICNTITYCSGALKYAAFLAYAMIGENKVNQFEYDDGSYWIIKNEFNYYVTPNTVVYTITINVDGDKNGCTYNPSSCKKPDQFIFKVDENGAVTAGDALTDAYLTNMNTINNQKADKELAEKYLKERKY